MYIFTGLKVNESGDTLMEDFDGHPEEDDFYDEDAEEYFFPADLNPWECTFIKVGGRLIPENGGYSSAYLRLFRTESGNLLRLWKNEYQYLNLNKKITDFL